MRYVYAQRRVVPVLWELRESGTYFAPHHQSHLKSISLSLPFVSHIVADTRSQEGHFDREHFLCPEPVCLERKFVVFNSAIELQAHTVAVHLRDKPMSQSEKKRARMIDIDFGSSSNASSSGGSGSSSSSSRGGRGGSRGGGGGGGKKKGRGYDDVQTLDIAALPRARGGNIANHTASTLEMSATSTTTTSSSSSGSSRGTSSNSTRLQYVPSSSTAAATASATRTTSSSSSSSLAAAAAPAEPPAIVSHAIPVVEAATRQYVLP